MHWIFVYGTLMRGHCRHPGLAGETFVREAQTAPLYRMVNCGTYPGLLAPSTGGKSIFGELWKVSDAGRSRLDEIEGVADELFVRRPIQILEAPPGVVVEAYFFGGDISGMPDCGVRWEGE